MITAESIDALNETQLRQTVRLLLSELRHKTALIDMLTHEMAVLKRLKFAAKSEAFNAEHVQVEVKSRSPLSGRKGPGGPDRQRAQSCLWLRADVSRVRAEKRRRWKARKPPVRSTRNWPPA